MATPLLAIRPIYHQTAAAIRGHGSCSFLAIVLRKELEERLASAQLKPEWRVLLADLDRLQEIAVEQDGKHVILRPESPAKRSRPLAWHRRRTSATPLPKQAPDHPSLGKRGVKSPPDACNLLMLNVFSELLISGPANSTREGPNASKVGRGGNPTASHLTSVIDARWETDGGKIAAPATADWEDGMELTIAALLGHAAHGVTQRYVHIDEALRVAADKVAAALAALLDGQPAIRPGSAERRRANSIRLADSQAR